MDSGLRDKARVPGIRSWIHGSEISAGDNEMDSGLRDEAGVPGLGKWIQGSEIRQECRG